MKMKLILSSNLKPYLNLIPIYPNEKPSFICFQLK